MFDWYYVPSHGGKVWSSVFLIIYILVLFTFILNTLIQLYLFADWKHTKFVQGKVVKVFNCKHEMITNPIEKLYISIQNVFRNLDGDILLSETQRTCAVEVVYELKKQVYTSATSTENTSVNVDDSISVAYDPNNIKDISLDYKVIIDTTFTYTCVALFLIGCLVSAFFYFQNYRWKSTHDRTYIGVSIV